MNLKVILSVVAVCGVALTAFLLSGPANQSQNQNSGNDAIQIVATTGQINSALQKITDGADVTIQLFCGPGVDPHSFSASTGDVQAMLDADLIVYNGFHLEARLVEFLHGKFEDKSWAMASAFPQTSRLDWVEDGEVDSNAPFDPHIWNHLPGWSQCVSQLAEQLGRVDPDNAELYRTNAQSYVAEIDEAHQWAGEQLKTIATDRRTIVSAHDAFNYFADEYDMQTLAVLGIGNDPEADIRTMREVAETICDRRIPAIFMESITNPKVTQALQEACAARNHYVTLVDTPLYSDDIGESAPQNTFLGAFRSNVQIICDSLK